MNAHDYRTLGWDEINQIEFLQKKGVMVGLRCAEDISHSLPITGNLIIQQNDTQTDTVSFHVTAHDFDIWRVRTAA